MPFSSKYSLLLSFYLLLHLSLTAQEANSFQWPEGKKAALSLSWDDARLSNVDVGTPLLNKYGVKATFYITPSTAKQRLEAWKQAVTDGHEIGNHTLVHPCSGNFPWSRSKALENYTLASMRQELLQANQEIEEMLGVSPTSFAYTCGQTYVGRGMETRSYVPLVAELFSSGRGWLDEASNDMSFADMAQLQGIEMDGKDFDEIKSLVDDAVANGRWLILAGHEIGKGGHQTTRVKMLEKLIEYVQSPNSGIWLATVGEIATYVDQQRNTLQKELKDALTLASTFDQGSDADFARGNDRIYTAPAYDETDKAVPGLFSVDVALAAQRGLYGNALQFTQKGKQVIFYQSPNNITYDENDWSGTISLWLSLNPEEDLAPGYTDPIQITDSGYDDAGFWVDFSNKNPRSFRMGLYGDVKVWNPKKLGPDENPAFNDRLLPAKDRPFSRETWTHVLISFSGINSGKGTASFYMNGIHQGDREITEPFTWDLAKSRIFLGLNFIGLMDEVALFDRALNKNEVKALYELPGGLNTLLKE